MKHSTFFTVLFAIFFSYSCGNSSNMAVTQQTNSSAPLSPILPYRIVTEGVSVPSNINLFDTDGNIHTLSEFRGKYILLDFWSAGCGPCIMAGAELRELHENYPDRLAVVSISIDNETVWKEATIQHSISWNNFSDNKGQSSGFCSHFRFEGIPYFVIVNPNGVVEKELLGYAEGYLKIQLSEYIEGLI